MPDNLPQRLADKLTIHDIELLRLAAGDSLRFEAQLAVLAAELVRRLIRANPPTNGRAPLEATITEARTVIRDFYRTAYSNTRTQLLAVMVAEYNAVAAAFGSSLGVPQTTARVLLGPNVPRATLRDIIDVRAMQASANDADTLRGFFEREAASHHRRYTGALRLAFSQDETITQMIQRLDNVTQIVAREADAVIRTAYNHTVTQLRIELMQRNSILFRGVIAIALLDSKTSAICRSRSRGQWDLNTGRPLPGSPVQIRFPGPTPWHMNERTQLYPMTREAAEMAHIGGDDVRDILNSLTPEQRRLLSADPPDDETYTQWLRRQSTSVQKQVLGPARQKLFQNGTIELSDLVNQKGRPLTLRQLESRIKRREAAA